MESKLKPERICFMTSEIKHAPNKFYRIVDNSECLLEYEIQDENTIVFFHTYVPEPVRGRGLAMDIIKQGLDFAVSKNLKIIALCSAVRTFILRHPEYNIYLR